MKGFGESTATKLVPSLADRFISYWYNNYFLHISCKFSVDVFGEDVNTFIDHSSPFFDLERERSKISRASPERGRIPIVFLFKKVLINSNKNQKSESQ